VFGHGLQTRVASCFLLGSSTRRKTQAFTADTWQYSKHVSQVTLGVTKHFGKDAKTRLESVLGTRDVFERAMRERLAAVYPNVAVRHGCGVAGLAHGTGDAQGLVTGARVASPVGPLLRCSTIMMVVLHSAATRCGTASSNTTACSSGHTAITTVCCIGPQEDLALAARTVIAFGIIPQTPGSGNGRRRVSRDAACSWLVRCMQTSPQRLPA